MSGFVKVRGEIKERFIRVFFEVVGGPASAGKVTAGIVGAVDESYKG
jgi:hypothetical protein